MVTDYWPKCQNQLSQRFSEPVAICYKSIETAAYQIQFTSAGFGDWLDKNRPKTSIIFNVM